MSNEIQEADYSKTYLVRGATIKAIANAIREKSGSTEIIAFKDFASKIKALNAYKYYIISITQSANQTITVNVNGQNYTNDVRVKEGTAFTATVAVNDSTNYKVGTLNMTSGIVNENVYINATNAIAYIWYTIKITQSANQTITVNVNGQNYTNDVRVKEGTAFSVSIVASSGYVAGTLNMTSGVANSDITVSATSSRPFAPVRVNSPTALSVAREDLAGASIGSSYALFAGGSSSGAVATVDAYNTSLTRSTPTALSVARYHLAGASIGSYALFAGGWLTQSTHYNTVDAYNTSLTQSTPTTLGGNRSYLAGASVGSYALFAGGRIRANQYSSVYAYNTSLTQSTPTALSSSRCDLAGASVGSYALFAGGSRYSGSNESAIVDAYNTSLTQSTPTALSVARYHLAGASIGSSYALFAGGSSSATVDAYNTSLTRSTPTALGNACTAGASLGNYALFAGGGSSNVYAYNTSLTRSTSTALSSSRRDLAGASVGSYALFAGGSRSATVDAYALG